MGINTASDYISCTLYSYSQNQNGFVQLSSSFTGGRISCSFVRSVLADNAAEDRNLNVAAYLLLAFGDTRGILHSVHYYCCLLYMLCLQWFTMMVFIHCTGGPDISLAAHNGASRRASPAQVTLTDAVTPMPVVSSYTCPCQCQSLHHPCYETAWIYCFCWLSASLPSCFKPHCYHIAPSLVKYVSMTVLCDVTTPTVLCIYCYIYMLVYVYIH